MPSSIEVATLPKHFCLTLFKVRSQTLLPPFLVFLRVNSLDLRVSFSTDFIHFSSPFDSFAPTPLSSLIHPSSPLIISGYCINNYMTYLPNSSRKPILRLDASPSYESLVFPDICSANCIADTLAFCMSFE